MATYETANGVYDSILVRGTPRYRLNKKMVAADTVPAEVKNYLEVMTKQEVMEREARHQEAIAEKEAAEQGDMPSLNVEATQEQIPLEPFEGNAPVIEGAPFTEAELDAIAFEEARRAGIESTPAFRTTKVQTVEELAQELYDKFGVWTVFANKVPELGDTHPITGKAMIRYDVGLGYRSWSHKGMLNQPVKVDREIPPTASIGMPEPRGYKTFAERTAPSFAKQSSTLLKNHDNDPISEEPTAEPNLRGQTVRTDW